LKYESNLRASNFSQLFSIQKKQIALAILYFAGGNSGIAGQEPQEAERQRALSRTGFSENTNSFPGADLQVDVAKHSNMTATLCGVVHAQIGYL
jgi:hypothetical protein